MADDKYSEVIAQWINRYPCVICETLTHNVDVTRHISVCSEEHWKQAAPNYPIRWRIISEEG